MDEALTRLGGLDWDLVASYGGLLSLAAISIYAGAQGSLPVCTYEPHNKIRKFTA